MNSSLEDIAQLLAEKDNFAIITHVNPDGDALGSAFGLKRALISMGKKAEVILDAPVMGVLAAFDWGGAVYSDDIPIPSVAVSVDNSDNLRMGRCLALFEKANVTICIDHHITNNNFAQKNYVDYKSASTGEIIYKLIRLLGVGLDWEIAQWLYIAVLSDTGGFRYSNTTPETLRTAAQLMETGIDSSGICRKVFDNIPIDRLRLQAEAISRIELFAGGRVSVMCIPLELMEEYNVCEEDLDGLVNIARSIRGVEVCALLKEREHEVKVSLRSNEYVNVADVAAKMGGGGHLRASGCTLQADLEHAKAVVVEALINSI